MQFSSGTVCTPIPNEPSATAFMTRVGFAIARIAFEPTGAYHHALERRVAAVGLPLVKVNPRRARRFAEAIGQHAKTDVIDADMLARFAALLEPPVHPW